MQNVPGLSIRIANMQETTTTIRVKVPEQEFDSILLTVSLTTTMKNIRKEIIDQLYLGRHTGQFAIWAPKTHSHLEPTMFPNDWTIQTVLAHGASEFELVRTDMF